MEMPARFTKACLWLVLLSTSSSAQLVDKAAFFHTCDASAGLAVNANLFVVASDEDNWLRVYDLRHPGPPLQTVNLTRLLGVASEEEMDIEGAAWIGKTSYWITSHGAKSSGKPAASRQFLFALDIKFSDGSVCYSVVGRPYRRLLDDLNDSSALAHFKFRAASQKPPTEKGALNIEGLCAIGDELLIGFRNPIPDGKAILVPLTNPRAVVDQSADSSDSAEFGEPILLDLRGRGIRTIEFDPSRKTFWIIAGALDSDRNFTLYRWQGRGQVPEDMGVKFGKWNPEALVARAGQDLQALSDDGERTVDEVDDEKACKDLPIEERRFRSGWIGTEE